MAGACVDCVSCAVPPLPPARLPASRRAGRVGGYGGAPRAAGQGLARWKWRLQRQNPPGPQCVCSVLQALSSAVKLGGCRIFPKAGPISGAGMGTTPTRSVQAGDTDAELTRPDGGRPAASGQRPMQGGVGAWVFLRGRVPRRAGRAGGLAKVMRWYYCSKSEKRTTPYYFVANRLRSPRAHQASPSPVDGILNSHCL